MVVTVREESLTHIIFSKTKYCDTQELQTTGIKGFTLVGNCELVESYLFNMCELVECCLVDIGECSASWLLHRYSRIVVFSAGLIPQFL